MTEVNVELDNLLTDKRVIDLLTEQEVSRSWRKLFNGNDITDDTLTKAGELLDELRAESPLRHRLSMELEELRKLHQTAGSGS